MLLVVNKVDYKNSYFRS